MNVIRVVRRPWHWLLIIPILCFGFQQNLAAQEISVSPAKIFFKESSSSALPSQRVLLHNNSGDPVIFKSTMADWRRDSLGNKVFFPPSSLAMSNAAWVEVQPNIVEIPPHSKREVTVVLHVPQNTAQKQQLTHSMLFLTQLNAQPARAATNGKTNIGVLVKLEFGIHVYYTPAMTEVRNLEFLNLTEKAVTIDNKKVHRVSVKVKNTGNVVTDGFLRFEITDKESGKEIKFPEKPLSMLPSDEQVIYLDMPASIKGAYLVVAILDSGEQTNLKVAKKDILLN